MSIVRVLVCWVGAKDLEGGGPIARALNERSFDAVQLLINYSQEDGDKYVRWLKKQPHKHTPGADNPLKIECEYHSLSSPANFEEIFPACRKTLKSLYKRYAEEEVDLTFHFSPGTSHMAAAWLILSESEFPARLIDSSPEGGVRDIHLPVSLTAEWLPAYIKNRDAKLEDVALESPPENAQFKNIIHKSGIMHNVVQKALKVAPRSVTVLIEGETGTGKELFARAIHDSSLRQDKPFFPVNCGALPKDLIASTLFGHEKGAFTGADQRQPGKFELASGGTLFLDELGELPLEAQVRFLRVLEEKKVWPVGARKAITVDVRIIAATNRSLYKEVLAGSFREDLFHRLAVAVIKLPPLRCRGEDIKLLLNCLLEKVNEESQDQPSYKDKKISPEGKNIMLRYAWPGNVRELLNTLRRIAIWSDDEIISAEEVQQALLTEIISLKEADDILGRELSQDFVLKDLLEFVEKHYIEKAWLQSGKKKQAAANLVGLNSHQNFGNKLKRFNLE